MTEYNSKIKRSKSETKLRQALRACIAQLVTLPHSYTDNAIQQTIQEAKDALKES